jgi:hypothetical protein
LGLPRDRRGGGIALNAPVANRERDLDELFPRAPNDALVVVDQVRNIGSLALRRAARGGQERLREAASEENLRGRLRVRAARRGDIRAARVGRDLPLLAITIDRRHEILPRNAL